MFSLVYQQEGHLSQRPRGTLRIISTIYTAKHIYDCLYLCHCQSKEACHAMRKLEYGPMPNVMAALPKLGGALCSMQQRLADAHYFSAVQ